MSVFYIILGCIVWYCIGLLGSAIAMGSIRRHLDALFPQFAPCKGSADVLVGFGMAFLGIGNLIGALIFSLTNKSGNAPVKFWK